MLVPRGFLVIAGLVWNACRFELCRPLFKLGAEAGSTFRLVGDEVFRFVGVAFQVEEKSGATGTEEFPTAFADGSLVPETPAEVGVRRRGVFATEERCQIHPV